MLTDNLKAAYQSERLVYRAVEDNDEDRQFLYTQIQNDPIISALGSSRVLKPNSIKDIEYLTKAMLQSNLAVVICLPSSEKEETAEDTKNAQVPIGCIIMGWGNFAGHTIHRSVNLGISLAAHYQNQGYGGEAVNWALDWAFRFGGYHRVALDTYSYNERALHLYKRLGFVEEGRSREAHWFARKWHDVVNFGILEHEWEILRGLREGVSEAKAP